MYNMYVHLHICLCLLFSLFLIPFFPHSIFHSPSISEQLSSNPFNSESVSNCFFSTLIAHVFPLISHPSTSCFPSVFSFPFPLSFPLSISSQIFPSSLISLIPIPTPSCLLSSLHSHPSHHLIHLCSSFLSAYALPITTMFFHVPLFSILISCPQWVIQTGD